MKMLKRVNPLIVETALFLFLFTALISYAFSDGLEPQKQNLSNNVTSNIISLIYTRLEEREEHIYLDAHESVTFTAPLEMESFQFKRTHVTIDATNRPFLKELKMDLYVETYNYWGDNVGAWTDNNNFSLTNPGEEDQELFLKISNRYGCRRYVMDNIEGTQHFIAFTTDIVADRISVNWGVPAALKYLEVNGTEIDVSDLSKVSQSRIMMEYTFRGASFRLPSSLKVNYTSFTIIVEEIELPQRPNSPRINAWIYPERVIKLNPGQEFSFEIPEIEGWAYSNGGFASNVTPSMYPTTYPFELINLAVWNWDETPVSTTPVDMNFGIRNLSNESYTLSFYPTLYYWQNQTGITYSHETNITETSIHHTYHVNISDASVDADLGLGGHYLSFGATGKTVRFDAPEPVGKFSNSYIPLKKGSYLLETVEPRIKSNVSINVDDTSLTAKLDICVMYDGNPYANAEINVLQKGTFTNRTYETSTNENGWASLKVHAVGPEIEKLEIYIKKDAYNYTTHNTTIIVGTLWIALIISAFILLTLLLIYYLKFSRKQITNKKR